MSHFRITIILASVGFILLVFITSSFACSYADGSLFPTHYDHIKSTAVIVLAEPYSKSGDKVDFRVKEVLKGDFTEQEFTTWEVQTSCNNVTFLLPEKTNLPPLLAAKLPINLSRRLPKYLLFLERTKNNWMLSVRATEAMNSPIWDEESSDSLLAVKHLIRISERSNYETEKRELKELRRLAKSGRYPEKYPLSLVKLVDDHLKAPTPSKSFQDLIEIYKRSKGDAKRDVLWAFAKGEHEEAAQFFTKLLNSPIPLNYIGPISQYITRTRNEALLLRLGRNYPTLDKSSRWPLMWALIKTADERHVGLMIAALGSAGKEEAGRLADWFVRFPNTKATEIVRGLVGGEYRENWELTFGLAGMGDHGTISWAKEYMNSDDDDRWMAFYAIAHSPLDEADSLAKNVIKGTDIKGLISLIQGYRDSRNARKYERLRDVIKLRGMDAEVENWLKQTLETMSEDGDARSSELLMLLGK